jgi:hypothetical protein
MNMLPGWFPFVSGALASFTAYGGSTTSTSLLTLPAGIAAGDLIVIGDRAANSSGLPTEVTPTGFTKISGVNDGSLSRFVTSYRLADGTEGGTTVATMVGTNGDRAICEVFRGNVPIKAVAVQSAAAEITDGNPTAQVVASGAGAVPLVVVGIGLCAIPTVDLTFSPAEDGSYAGSTTSNIKWKFYTTAPANVTADVGDTGGSNALGSFYVECS